MDIYKNFELQKLIDSKNIISCDVTIYGNEIKSFNNIFEIHGNLSLVNSALESFGNLKYIKGNLVISSNNVESSILSLENIEEINGDCWLRRTNVKSLGKLRNVYGNLNLRDTEIDDFGNLSYVGGNLFLSTLIKRKLNIQNINVKGKIRYWKPEKNENNLGNINNILDKELVKISFIPFWEKKYVYSKNEFNNLEREQKGFYSNFKRSFLENVFWDLKDNENYVFLLFHEISSSPLTENTISHLNKLKKYYPYTSQYVDDILIQHYNSHQCYEDSWKLIQDKTFINIDTIVEYEQKLGRKILTGDIILKVTPLDYLTPFGIKNLEEIKRILETYIYEYEHDNNIHFFDSFIYLNYDDKKNTDYLYSLFILFSKAKRNIEFLGHYKQFFINTNEFNEYISWDLDRIEKANKFYELPHLVKKSIISQFKIILRNSENILRSERNIPLIGEGWISETDLYYKIKEEFKQYRVIHHARPHWLGRQHLDIYIKELNIGIEYQGKQHFEPVDFFGGEESFKNTVERDERKKQICIENDCLLIYVEENYNFQEICEIITNSVKDK